MNIIKEKHELFREIVNEDQKVLQTIKEMNDTLHNLKDAIEHLETNNEMTYLKGVRNQAKNIESILDAVPKQLVRIKIDTLKEISSEKDKKKQKEIFNAVGTHISQIGQSCKDMAYMITKHFQNPEFQISDVFNIIVGHYKTIHEEAEQIWKELKKYKKNFDLK